MKEQIFKPEPVITSGLESLDEVIQGLRLGDNVVWQVDQLQGQRQRQRENGVQSAKSGSSVCEAATAALRTSIGWGAYRLPASCEAPGAQARAGLVGGHCWTMSRTV